MFWRSDFQLSKSKPTDIETKLKNRMAESKSRQLPKVSVTFEDDEIFYYLESEMDKDEHNNYTRHKVRDLFIKQSVLLKTYIYPLYLCMKKLNLLPSALEGQNDVEFIDCWTSHDVCVHYLRTLEEDQKAEVLSTYNQCLFEESDFRLRCSLEPLYLIVSYSLESKVRVEDINNAMVSLQNDDLRWSTVENVQTTLQEHNLLPLIEYFGGIGWCRKNIKDYERLTYATIYLFYQNNVFVDFILLFYTKILWTFDHELFAAFCKNNLKNVPSDYGQDVSEKTQKVLSSLKNNVGSTNTRHSEFENNEQKN